MSRGKPASRDTDSSWSISLGRPDGSGQSWFHRPFQNPEIVTEMLYKVLRTSLRVSDGSYHKHDGGGIANMIH